MEGKEKKELSYRKRRKLEKKQRRVLYRILHQKKKPAKPLFVLEVALGVICEAFRIIRVTFFRLLLLLVVVGIAGGIFAYNKFYPMYKEYSKYADELVSQVTYADFNINESSTVYNSDGDVLAVLRENADSKYLNYEDIPQDVVNAFIAVEDRTFWENDGVDYKGIARVILRAIKTEGDEVHGASTITQQLVRNNFLTREVSIERKAKELLIARRLAKQFSKREIMEFYVNDICYANGIYGISGASKAYFNKDISDCSLSEVAYLCAIPNRPSYYDPYKSPENAIERRDKIIDDMLECGMISLSDARQAKSKEISISKPEQVFNDYETTYAVDCAIRYLMGQDGFEFKYSFENMDEYRNYHSQYDETYAETRHKLYTGGYKIYTSLDSEAYEGLQTVLDEGLAVNEEVNEETGIYTLQGAITVIDNETGKVVAVVGGRSQEKENQVYGFNRAYQSYRQPGSSIKPIIVYTPALERGYKDTTTVYNINVDAAKKKGADPQKMTGTAMTLREAVEKSRNGVAWQVFDKITPSVGLSYVENMHYSNLCPDDYFDASSLGGLTNGVTTVEQASAYAALSNHGVFRDPTCIVSILNREEKEIYKDPEEVQIYKSKAADDMVDILKGVLFRGTASNLKWSKSTKMDAFCKTGTTNNSKDGWLCGSTPPYSIAVWVGFDQPRAMNNLYGNTYPGQIWKSAMLYMIDGLPEQEFVRAEYSDEDLEIPEMSGGWDSYLPGRSDDEVLSSGYTVRDYREDRVTGERVWAIIQQIQSLEKGDPQIESLYEEGKTIIKDEIYSRKYTNEMTGNLDAAYNSKK